MVSLQRRINKNQRHSKQEHPDKTNEQSQQLGEIRDIRRSHRLWPLSDEVVQIMQGLPERTENRSNCQQSADDHRDQACPRDKPRLALNNITAGVCEREEGNRTRVAGHLDEIQGAVANTLNLSRHGAVGFIGWLDVFFSLSIDRCSIRRFYDIVCVVLSVLYSNSTPAVS